MKFQPSEPTSDGLVNCWPGVVVGLRPSGGGRLPLLLIIYTECKFKKMHLWHTGVGVEVRHVCASVFTPMGARGLLWVSFLRYQPPVSLICQELTEWAGLAGWLTKKPLDLSALTSMVL